MPYKLGCHISPPKDRKRTLKLSEFRVALPAFPQAQDWYAKTSGIKMHRNDELGDCTCAAKANLEQVWSANAGSEVIQSDDLVVLDYERVGGYDPTRTDKDGYNPTDNGAVMSEVLKYWQDSGRIGPYLEVHADDWEEVCYACDVGVGLYCGLSLPQCAMDAMDKDVPTWQMPTTKSEKRIIGGHCVIDCSYNVQEGVLGTGTWAKVVPTTADFVAAFFSEMYVIFSNQFMAGGISPAGLNGQAIIDAMEQVKERG